MVKKKFAEIRKESLETTKKSGRNISIALKFSWDCVYIRYVYIRYAVESTLCVGLRFMT